MNEIDPDDYWLVQHIIERSHESYEHKLESLEFFFGEIQPNRERLLTMGDLEKKFFGKIKNE